MQALPPQGRPADDVLRELESRKVQDIDSKSGRLWSLVYYHSPELLELAQKAYALYISENALNPMAFPSLRRMENEIVSIVKSLLHAPSRGAGTLTSGGTESIFLALKAARDYMRVQKPHLSTPEVIAPVSAHPAFDKAAHYLGLKIVHTPVTAEGAADVQAMEAAITERTILLVGSAPSYPHGVIDPIPEIAALAQRYNLLCHVDACVGGLILPFLEKNGVALPPYDFRVEGVSSMSADLHKYGYTPKGASVVLYRDRQLRRYQFFIYGSWSGGVYASASFSGTRSAGAIAAAWAVLQYLGESGYREAAQKAWETTQRIKQAVGEIPGLYIVGKPHATVLAIGAVPPLDIYRIGDGMSQRGWHLDRQQMPPSLHLTITAGHARVVEEFIQDLTAVVEEERSRSSRRNWQRKLGRRLLKTGLAILPERWVRGMARLLDRTAQAERPPQRTAALYGMMAALPKQGSVEKLVEDFLDKALEH
ncbi:MAG: aspartate aminotransferase family protein [Bacteroidia bacterium]|nr:aspartate aminotransferase family protein [Bacteroidia bacterium]MCX7763495.1 aspartate aminotransferase family protein [Bacteroidia bacterium]MDW8057391.1 aspartate aminotransferase family protein [Bacteroidia bacterium]